VAIHKLSFALANEIRHYFLIIKFVYLIIVHIHVRLLVLMFSSDMWSQVSEFIALLSFLTTLALLESRFVSKLKNLQRDIVKCPLSRTFSLLLTRTNIKNSKTVSCSYYRGNASVLKKSSSRSSCNQIYWQLIRSQFYVGRVQRCDNHACNVLAAWTWKYL